MGFKTTRVPQFWSLNPLFTMWQRQYYGLYHTCNCLAHTVWYNLGNFPDTAKFLWHIHHVPLLPHTFLIPWQFQVSPFCRQVVTLLNACKHYLMKLEEKTKTKIKFIVLRSTSTTDIAAHHSHHCHSCHMYEWHFTSLMTTVAQLQCISQHQPPQLSPAPRHHQHHCLPLLNTPQHNILCILTLCYCIGQIPLGPVPRNFLVTSLTSS